MEYIILIVIYLIVLNIVTTSRLLKSDLYEKYQKVFQTIFVWLLPFLGPMIVSMFLNEYEPIELNKKSIIKSIIFYIFIVKIKKIDKKKNIQGYGEKESIDNYTYTAMGD